MRKRRETEFDAELVSKISLSVYRDRLGPDDVQRLVQDHGLEKAESILLSRSKAYDKLTRCYLRAINNHADY